MVRPCNSSQVRVNADSLTVLLVGMSGITGYPLKGVDVAVTNAFRADSAKSIKSSRIAQGEREYLEVNEEERRAVVDRWHELLAAEQLRKAQTKRKGKEKAQGDNKSAAPDDERL